MAGRLIVVRAAWDREARVWYVESADLAGIRAEAPTLEDLTEKLPAIVADLVGAGGFDDDGDGEPLGEVPIEIIAHTTTRVRLGPAA